MKNFSAVIITKNEEKNIGRCLNSIKDLADEIVIVDSGSTDNTLKIVRKYTNKIFFRKWSDDYAAQKNYALSKASGNWILSLDADEQVPLSLVAEIKDFFNLKKEKKYSGMWLSRKNIVYGRWLKHGDCWPDYQLKVFRYGNYFQRAVHETVVINGSCGFFIKPIIHHSYKDIKSFIQRAQKYTDIEVKVLIQEQKKASVWRIFVYPIAKFLKVYVFKKGFLDGWYGLIDAGLLAYYSFLKRFKYYKIAKK